MRNPWLCLSIVLLIGAGALVGTAGYVALSMTGHEIPQALIAAVSGCWGALGTFLVQPPRGQVGLGGGGDGQQMLLVRPRSPESAA